MSLRRVRKPGAATPSRRANKPHSKFQDRKTLNGPVMRPTTPRVTESGVGEPSTCYAGAQRWHLGKRAWRTPTPPFEPLLGFGQAGALLLFQIPRPTTQQKINDPPKSAPFHPSHLSISPPVPASSLPRTTDFQICTKKQRRLAVRDAVVQGRTKIAATPKSAACNLLPTSKIPFKLNVAAPPTIEVQSRVTTIFSP